MPQDPLESLLVETEGIYLVQVGTGGQVTWCRTSSESEARTEAQKQALAQGKPAYVFRAVARVKTTAVPVNWIEYD